MKPKITTLLLLIFVSCSLFAGEKVKEQKAKYVFYFIGDGMGFSHVSITEAFQAFSDGKNGSEPLSFSKFPVMGKASTYSNSSMVTCSSAAGTALSTGYKTNNGFLGVAPDSTNLKSIAYMIHEAGYKVGISSTVYLNHATPASFYAHSISRNNYYDIAVELPTSGFEFFAGGGYSDPYGQKEDKSSAYNVAVESGYVIAAGLDEYKTKKKDAGKIILLQDSGCESSDLPYAIDQVEGDMNQADLVSTSIDFLYNKKGFFMMSEGGKIDWASHVNDTQATIYEMIDFSNAVDVAYQFYLEHPDETLIVVTADHETGGFCMANGKGYKINFKTLSPIVQSYDYYMGKRQPEMVAYANALTERCGLGWMTKDHSGVAVPVFAIGVGSDKFSGSMDNTDIPKKICAAMGIKFE